MNKTIKIMAALLPLFITSCTNDDANVTTTPQQDPVVTLSAGITRGEGETGTTNTEPDPFSYNKIKVINVTRQEKGLPYSQAVFSRTFNVSENAWTPWTSDSPLLWCGGMENTFHAVYPATADYSSFTVPADQSTEAKLKSADWMTGEAKVTLANLDNASALDINMTRKMAMVEVTVELVNANWNDNEDYAYFILPVNQYANNSESKTKALIETISDETNKRKFTAIIPAGNITSESIFYTIYLKNENTILAIEKELSFEAGKKYTFTAKYDLLIAPKVPTRSAAPDNLTLVSVEPM